MVKVKIAFMVLVGLVILLGLIFFTVGLLKPKVAGIYIETNPATNVFINSEREGRTPFRTKMSPGEITLRLIPDSIGVSLSTYETRVLLVEGVETVIRRNLGENDQTSEGETISFEKTSGTETSLVVVSVPDSAGLLIDGTQKAFTPYKTTSITAGEHTLSLTAQGFRERTFRVKTYPGYKLTALVKLSEEKGPKELSVTPGVDNKDQNEVIEKKSVIEIMSTPTGFLRVREQPSTLADEVGRVNPGETYEVLEEDEKTGWYKIEYEEGGKVGWISNQYAKKAEVRISPVPTPTLNLVPTLRNSPTMAPNLQT